MARNLSDIFSGELSERLTTDGGTRIDWGAVVAVSFGLVTSAFTTSLAELIAMLFEFGVIRPIEAATRLLTTILTLFSIPVPATIRGSWLGASDFVETLGPFGFAAALLIVGATAYTVAVVIDRA